MHKLVKYCLGLALAMTASTIYAEDDSTLQPLKIGVVPYLSARALVTSYEPMRLYLEQALGRQVTIYTAAGFKPFFSNTRQGDYDLVITAAHFARILQKEQKYTPLARYSNNARGIVMTALNSPFKTLQDLRGHVIAVPDRLSMAAIVSMAYLRDNGLHPGTDFQLLEVPSFASAILAVQKGDATAAISARAPLAHMSAELRESVRTIAETSEYFSLVFLAHPRLQKTTGKLLNKELLKFGNETDEGRQFLSSTGFGAIIPATAKDMNNLDRYVAETKRLLDETP